jgi:hypothetical protein
MIWRYQPLYEDPEYYGDEQGPDEEDQEDYDLPPHSD